MRASWLLPAALASFAAAQQPAYAQCGGIGHSGGTTCVSGYTCKYVNDWYSQCIPGSGSDPNPQPQPTTTLQTSTTKVPEPTNNPQPQPGGKFKWYGSNVAGAEFGEGNYPGQLGTHYIWPDTAAIDKLIADGYNTFRIGFSMERLAEGQLTAEFATAYKNDLVKTVKHVTGKGAWAVLDPHNYGRYHGQVITDVAAFKSFWTKLATLFKDDANVVFDTNNEYHSMEQSNVISLNQGAIDAIRATGATSQYIFVEGNQWSGAWSWVDVNDGMKVLTDPQDKLVFEMHQYLDGDSSGTHPECVSTTIGVERVKGATEWLRANKKIGILGEFAGAANSQCKEAVKNLLDYVSANTDVWHGALWWAAGPWWGNYMFNFEPPSGAGYTYYNELLKTYQ